MCVCGSRPCAVVPFIRSDVEIIFNYAPKVLLDLTEELVGDCVCSVCVC